MSRNKLYSCYLKIKRNEDKNTHFYKYAIDEKSSEFRVIDSREGLSLSRLKKTHFTASVISAHSAAI